MHLFFFESWRKFKKNSYCDAQKRPGIESIFKKFSFLFSFSFFLCFSHTPEKQILYYSTVVGERLNCILVQQDKNNTKELNNTE
jgi:hypothetical protein